MSCRKILKQINMCVCVCVCVYIREYVCTHTHTHTRTHARARAHTHTHTHIHRGCGKRQRRSPHDAIFIALSSCTRANSFAIRSREPGKIEQGSFVSMANTTSFASMPVTRDEEQARAPLKDTSLCGLSPRACYS